MGTASERYQYWLDHWNDVQEHLPTLFREAHGNVLELGVRAGASTSALLAGVEAHGGHVYSVDRDDCSPVFAGHPQWTFIQADSCDVELSDWEALKTLDLLFIDTEHTEDRTIAELRLWGPRAKTIMLHDTDDGSTYPGVRNAITTYCEEAGRLAAYRTGSYGLGIIE